MMQAGVVPSLRVRLSLAFCFHSGLLARTSRERVAADHLLAHCGALLVALLPPLVSIGIGLGGTDWNLMRQAIVLFFTNLVGIVFAALIVFGLLGYRQHRRTLEVEVKKEEKVLES